MASPTPLHRPTGSYQVDADLEIPLAPRGVGWATGLDPSGYPILIAIDSQHRRMFHRVVYPGLDWRVEARALRDALDIIDPPHRSDGAAGLALVK